MEYQGNGDKCARRRAGRRHHKLEREIADALAHSSTDDEMERLRCELTIRRVIEEKVMFGVDAVDAELSQSLGVTLTGLAPILKRGGDEAEKKFMECCWCLWRANGSDLLEPFIEAAFNTLPKKSRAVLFERMLTIVYVAQDSAVKNSTDVRSRG